MNNTSEHSQEIKKVTPRPGTLDVVRINDRWAQVASVGVSDSTIVYLDNNATEIIDWDSYSLVKKWDTHVEMVKRGEDLSNIEIGNIHWGPEEAQHPSLKHEVNVFGEYKKKT